MEVDVGSSLTVLRIFATLNLALQNVKSFTYRTISVNKTTPITRNKRHLNCMIIQFCIHKYPTSDVTIELFYLQISQSLKSGIVDHDSYCSELTDPDVIVRNGTSSTRQVKLYDDVISTILNLDCHVYQRFRQTELGMLALRSITRLDQKLQKWSKVTR